MLTHKTINSLTCCLKQLNHFYHKRHECSQPTGTVFSNAPHRSAEMADPQFKSQVWLDNLCQDSGLLNPCFDVNSSSRQGDSSYSHHTEHKTGSFPNISLGLQSPNIGVGAQSTLDGKAFLPENRKYMYEKLTKSPNFTRHLPEKYFSRFFWVTKIP